MVEYEVDRKMQTESDLDHYHAAGFGSIIRTMNTTALSRKAIKSGLRFAVNAQSRNTRLTSKLILLSAGVPTYET